MLSQWLEGMVSTRVATQPRVNQTFHNALLADGVCAISNVRFHAHERLAHKATHPTRMSVLAGLASPFASDLGIRVIQLLTVPLSSSAAAIP